MLGKAITCISWIPKGASKVVPDKYDDINDDAIDSLIEQQESLSLEQFQEKAKAENISFETLDIDDVDGGEDDDADDETPMTADGEEDILKALDIDNYDESGSDEDQLIERLIGNAQGLDPALDPFLDGESDDDEDHEDNMIRVTDSCILVGGANDDGESQIEVYVYDESTSNLYVHHEISVPAFPLCVQWFNVNPVPKPALDNTVETTGSYVAVGSFLPAIEIWNVDVINPLEPLCILGGYASQQDKALMDALEEPTGKKNVKGKGKGKKAALPKPKLKEGSHTDAVMCLAWHPAIANRLASGSADKTIKLWDILSQECVQTLTHHKGKVQSIDWNPTEHHILLSGSYDRTVCVGDVRAPNNFSSFKVKSDVETTRWNPHSPFHFVVSTEDGEVLCYDIRNINANTKPIWSVPAHKQAVSALSFNAAVPGVFATSSVDNTIKIWDTNKAAVPECIATRNLKIGQLYTMSFDVSSPFVLAAGGKEGCLALWDILENYEVNQRYGKHAESLGLGSQELPAEYIEMQKRGEESRGIGPGVEGSKAIHPEDDQSDDERKEFMDGGYDM